MALSYYMQKRKWTMQRLNGSGCIEISLAPKSSRCSHSYCQDEYRRLVDRAYPYEKMEQSIDTSSSCIS